MKLGICTALDALAEAAEAGFNFAELSTGSLAPGESETDFAAVRRRILAAPIRVEVFNVFLFGNMRVTGPDVDLASMRRHMEVALRRAGEVGAAVMVFGSGGARRLPEGFPVERGWSQLAEAARLAADIAAHHGLIIAMEPLFKRGCNLFNRVDQGAALVDRVGHDHLRLLADMFHMDCEQEPLAHIVAAGQRLAHIHVATPSLLETAEGTAYDYAGFFAALRQAGYKARVSLEDNQQLLARSRRPRAEACRAVREFLTSYCRD